ncbi:transmembrane emp24 domain-containing protein 5-like [Acanthaster planci]|uniref:Transmembrane emp24 domain-containing protein 5-like n=1 Tax=Acanthaster planci TaxID=133434 RepID=A0A8B7YZB2_ACAPL|nr:transmembrane emp24 domain-containing protein 5-like [Acanthaster planci]
MSIVEFCPRSFSSYQETYSSPKMWQYMYFIAVFMITVFGTCWCVEHDLTIVVPAGRRECFHQHIKAQKTLDFEFQVIEGGDMDINFILRTPTNKALATEARKQEGIYTFSTQETGDYLFCFDNSFSRMSEKLVYFDLALDYDDEDEVLKKPPWMDLMTGVGGTDTAEVRLEEIQTSLGIVRDNLHKSVQTQRLLRNVEFRDRFIAERNYERVSFWSILTTVVMLVTFLIQVIMIRSLFSSHTGGKTATKT